MRTWSPHSHYSLNALPHEGEATVIEQYNEKRNGFAVGEKVRGIFPDGSAVLEITTDTQTFIASAIGSQRLRSAGFDSIEELQAAVPGTQARNIVSIVRFRVLQVLPPEGKKDESA